MAVKRGLAPLAFACMLGLAFVAGRAATARAQEMPPDLLAPLQTTTDLSVVLRGKMTFADGQGATTVIPTSIAWDNWMAGLGVSDGFGGAFAGAPLTWSGRAFAMQFAAGDVAWSVQGALSADGRAVERLAATKRLATCGDPRGCAAPTDYDETSFDLDGPIPFAEVEEMRDFDGSIRVCANFRRTGPDIAEVVRSAADLSVWPGDSRRFISLDYEDAGDPAELTVSFCGLEPLIPRAVPTGLTWVFAGSDDVMPAALPFPFCYNDAAEDAGWQSTGFLCTAAAADGAQAGDIGPICRWDGGVELEEALPIDSDMDGPTGFARTWREITTYCDGVGSTSSWESFHAWSAPPYYLVPNQEIQTELGVATTTTDSWPPPPADTVLLLDPEGRDLVTGRLPAPYADEATTIIAQLGSANTDGEQMEDSPQRSENIGYVAWVVPGGVPGDRLALGTLVRGAGGARLVIYEYEMRSLRPEAPPATSEEAETAEDPFEDLDAGVGLGSLDIPPDLIDLLPAGFGDLGNIPGPDNLIQTLAGVLGPATLIAILSALGHFGGAAGGVDPRRLLPGEPGDHPPMTMTDALGRQFTYVWSPEYGGYINPDTGGMLDPNLWAEYNRSLADNQAFVAAQREKLAARDTAFDREMDALLADQARQAALADRLERAQEAGYGLGPDGARASARAADLLARARAGEKLSADQVAAVERFVEHRAGGQSAPESSLSPISNWTLAADTVTGSIRTTFTGRNPDGTTNWAAIAGRVGTAVATLGASEFVFTPIEAGYVLKDGLDQGQSVSRAMVGAGGTVVVGVVIGKAAGAAIGVGGRILGATGRAASRVFPGVSRALGEGVEGLGKEFKALGGLAGDAVEAVGKRLGLGSKAVTPPLTPELQAFHSQFKHAMSTGDDLNILGLYRSGGMQKLGRLEQLGLIAPRQAALLNRTLSRNVQAVVREATENTVTAFEQKTGVRISEVLVGDSGSSARGGMQSVVTDFDRTTVVGLDRASLERYAAAKGISIGQAEARLSSDFARMHQRQVNRVLGQGPGTGQPTGPAGSGWMELSASDVDFKTYNRIGAGAGQSDAYPLGYTNTRQSIWGTTERYYRGPDGQMRVVQVSGDTIVDANAMQTARITGRMPADPTRIDVGEMQSLLRQQVSSANSHADVKPLAKALGRADYAAQRLGVQIDPNFVDIANQVTANPQEMNRILTQNGLTPEQFVQRSRWLINEVARVTR